MTLFRGLSAFPLTPTSASGDVRPDLLRRFLDRLIVAKVDSIGLLGSTGGYAYLTHEQRLDAMRVATGYVAGRVPLIVGVSALRTDAAVALAREARTIGAAGLLLAPMSYTPLMDDEVYEHFAAVAQAGGLPLCIYNNPGTTHFIFTPNLIARLARLPHIAAIKMPLPADGDHGGELTLLRERMSRHFSVGYSGDWGAANALLAGADAWYSVVAGLLPAPALALTKAAQSGDKAATGNWDATLEPIWDLFRRFGSFRVMFALADALGLGAGEPPRPVLPLPATELPCLNKIVRLFEGDS